MLAETSTERAHALRAAAEAALLAPSAFNTQPWHWQLAGDVLTLFAERQRRLVSSDPDGRLLLLSCGAALHHARLALGAAGWSARVDRLPEAGQPDLLARIHLGHRIPPDPEAQMMAPAMRRRRTDRRAFGDRTVPEPTLTRLRRFVEAEGAYLHVVRPDQVPMLAISTAHAGNAELDDPAYRAELREWTSRPSWSGDGVPAANAVAGGPRRVPMRDLAPHGHAGLAAGDDVDRGASYVILFGPGDTPGELLRAGEALSALLLKATSAGLATAPLSDAVEVGWTRSLLRDLLAGIGQPYVAVRLGYVHGDPLPATPRRDPAEVISIGQ